MAPKTDGLLESSLYVSDVRRSVRFYQDLFGFRVISEFGERGCAMHAGPRQVLLLFKKGCAASTRLTMETANYMSRLRSPLPNWPAGSHGSREKALRWKRSGHGIRVVGASTFETRTDTWSSSPRQARGPFIEGCSIDSG
jgi:catechol 2,3-dioxygenase-like lactoylglutathione lyase family enzyme